MITNQFLTNDQPVNWPQNRRAAAMLTIDVDTVTPMLWRKRKSNQFSTAEIEQRSFGLRQGVGRLLAMLDELELKAVFFLIKGADKTKRSMAENGQETRVGAWRKSSTREKEKRRDTRQGDGRKQVIPGSKSYLL